MINHKSVAKCCSCVVVMR